MLFSYLSITLRNFLRRPVYSAINILGLTFGLAIAGLSALYLNHELSYDAFHPGAENIYRISGQQSDTWFASLSTRYSNALFENQFAEAEKTVRIRRWPAKYIQYRDEVFYERKVFFTDPRSDFFTLFNFKSVSGNLQNALRDPNSVVITESVAARIFGSSDAVGQGLTFDTLELKVTAVIEDLPSNTHLDFKVLITNENAMARASALSTYCVIGHKENFTKLKKKLMAVSVPSAEFSALQDCKIIPLKDLHYEGNLTYEMKPAGNKMYLLVFTLIGSAILLLSCFNFINLSVAVYAQRAKEIAIRKIVGAGRKHISIQFLIESVSMTLVAFPFVLLLLQLTLPWFNSFMSINLENSFLVNVRGFFLLLTVTAAVGLFAGAYPAFILPRINALALFGKSKITALGSLNLRTVLVAFQITVMIVMLSGSIIIQTQMRYLNEKDLGFQREGIIKLKGAWSVDSTQYATIKTKLLQNPRIVSVSQGFAPGDEEYGFPFRAEGSDIVYNDLISFGTDADYIRTLEFKLLQLQDGLSLDKHESPIVLVNETLAKRLGYHDPIGKCVVVAPGKKHERNRIINGVFTDFHFFSLHQGMAPMMLTLRRTGSGINENILVRVNTSGISESVDYISATVREVAPNIPLTPEFLDDSLAKLYEKEQKLSLFSTILLSITILLSALGLVGLSSYVAQLKTKEIGIRKVLGASISSILQLISAPFVKLAFLAFVVGSCVSWYLMHSWLQTFTYRVPISFDFYLYTFAGLLVLLLLTVGSHALKASMADPVKSLKSE
jgi:putative ABC transport system permease protein